LHRYTGDEDIVVGSTYANRERAEAEKLIGMLAITLVLRVDLSAVATFRELLKRVREVCLDAYSYQLTPELLREDLAQRGEERDRLFDVWFQLDKERKEQLAMKDMEVVPYLQAKEVSRFELSMALGERDEDIVGVVDYDEEIFTSKTIAQMLHDYSNLLTTMVAEPDRDLKTVSLTSKHDIERLSSAFVANLEI
jgi:non-ribosomal peptide synthetase component F